MCVGAENIIAAGNRPSMDGVNATDAFRSIHSLGEKIQIEMPRRACINAFSTSQAKRDALIGMSTPMLIPII